MNSEVEARIRLMDQLLDELSEDAYSLQRRLGSFQGNLELIKEELELLKIQNKCPECEKRPPLE